MVRPGSGGVTGAAVSGVCGGSCLPFYYPAVAGDVSTSALWSDRGRG